MSEELKEPKEENLSPDDKKISELAEKAVEKISLEEKEEKPKPELKAKPAVASQAEKKSKPTKSIEQVQREILEREEKTIHKTILHIVELVIGLIILIYTWHFMMRMRYFTGTDHFISLLLTIALLILIIRLIGRYLEYYETFMSFPLPMKLPLVISTWVIVVFMSVFVLLGLVVLVGYIVM